MSRFFHHDENTVLFSLFEHLPSAGEVQMLELNKASTFEQPQRFGCFKLVSDPSLYAVSTLGSKSDHVFLMIAGSNPNNFLPVLGSIEKADAAAPFAYGEHVRLNDRYLESTKRVGALFAEPALSPMLLNFPAQQKIDGHMLTFFLTIFLQNTEYAEAHTAGIDKLLKRFHEEPRLLIGY